MSNLEPVIVLYKSSKCGHCISLTNIWDNVVSNLKKVYPKLRFYTVTSKDNDGKFDPNTTPSGLAIYSKWFPQILLIPGNIWNEAMSKLGDKNDVELIDGVQIMNGKWINNVLKYNEINPYDIREASEFSRWLEEALKNEDFIKVQNLRLPKNLTVPVLNSPKILEKNKNSNSTYIMTSNFALSNNICSMKIITRPK